MTHSISLVILCPIGAKETVAGLSEKLGYSRNEFTVRCSPSGEEPATHIGLRAAVSEATAYMWTQMPAAEFAAATMPAPTSEAPSPRPLISQVEVTEMRSILIIDAQPETVIKNAAHFDAVGAANGLQRIVSDGSLQLV